MNRYSCGRRLQASLSAEPAALRAVIQGLRTFQAGECSLDVLCAILDSSVKDPSLRQVRLQQLQLLLLPGDNI
jgi:hypothetical protein